VYPHYKVLPDKQKADSENGDYEGAFVWPTQPGIYKYIGGLDFASLYPSIIRQFQISPETFLFKDPNYKPKPNEIKTCSGAVYRKDPDAIIPAILTHYFALRKQAKKDKKQANQEMEDLKHILEERKRKMGAA
jgi:DNA polymerase elongation subunit (family B)